MKQYNQPETTVLQIINTSSICIGSGTSTPIGGQLGTMNKASVNW